LLKLVVGLVTVQRGVAKRVLEGEEKNKENQRR